MGISLICYLLTLHIPCHHYKYVYAHCLLNSSYNFVEYLNFLLHPSHPPPNSRAQALCLCTPLLAFIHTGYQSRGFRTEWCMSLLPLLPPPTGVVPPCKWIRQWPRLWPHTWRPCEWGDSEEWTRGHASMTMKPNSRAGNCVPSNNCCINTRYMRIYNGVVSHIFADWHYFWRRGPVHSAISRTTVFTSLRTTWLWMVGKYVDSTLR